MRTDIPRLIVLKDGTEVPGLVEGTIELVAAQAASRFLLTFAARSVPAETFDDPEQRFTLVDARSGTTMLTGRADAVSVERTHGIMTVEGRDLAALFIDQMLTETFANQPAGEIATGLAGRHALSAAVTATTTPAGRLFGSDHALMALGTEWDLLSALALAEGFDLHVADTTLFFGPPAAAVPFALRPSDCISLRQTTAQAVARAVELTVRSWDAANARPVVHTATRGRGKARRQHMARPNLTPETAERLAEGMLADLARFERTAVVTMPGEGTLGIGSVVTIEGESFRVGSLLREWGPGGFVQSLTLQAGR